MRNTLGGEMPPGLLETYLQPWRQFAVFKGRSTRREYWTFVLLNGLIVLALTFVDRRVGGHLWTGDRGVLTTLFGLVEILPAIAVGVRRLHDSGLSGLWILVDLIPFLGWIVSIILMLRASEPRDNRFGPATVVEFEADIPSDGGPPYAVVHGGFATCPWCGRTNPLGRESCQWCHRLYRERGEDAVPA